MDRKQSQGKGNKPAKPEGKAKILLPDAKRCEVLRKQEAEMHGNRTSCENMRVLPVAIGTGAKSGAVEGSLHGLDDELKTINEVWPRLPKNIRERCLMMIQAYS